MIACFLLILTIFVGVFVGFFPDIDNPLAEVYK